MQTICANCYRSLKFKEKSQGLILCQPCEQAWEHGVKHDPHQHLAGWVRPATWATTRVNKKLPRVLLPFGANGG